MEYNAILKTVFTLFIVIPLARLWLGLRINNKQAIPLQGPAVIIANHNSHLDTLALFSLFPLTQVSRIRPVAAGDYFLDKGILSWFAVNVIGIIPIQRGSGKRLKTDIFEECKQALNNGDILIIFPEGTRGKAEEFGALKSGLWHLMEAFPSVPVVPVWLSGLGRVMGKGNHIPLPLFVDVVVGSTISFHSDKKHYVENIKQRFTALEKQAQGDRLWQPFIDEE